MPMSQFVVKKKILECRLFESCVHRFLASQWNKYTVGKSTIREVSTFPFRHNTALLYPSHLMDRTVI